MVNLGHLVPHQRTTIPKDAIHRVIVRNHILKSAENIIVVATPGAQSGGQQNVVAGMN
ncbi:MAG: hypothetical protein ACLPOO_09985 [Terriglobales bacterium]